MVVNLNSKKRYKAAVALITVLLITSVLLVSGVSLVLITIDLGKTTKGLSSTTLAEVEARNCFEESLLKVNRLKTYTGTITITKSNSSCSSNVTNDPVVSTKKIVLLTGIYGDYHYTQTKQIDTTTDPVTIL